MASMYVRETARNNMLAGFVETSSLEFCHENNAVPPCQQREQIMARLCARSLLKNSLRSHVPVVWVPGGALALHVAHYFLFVPIFRIKLGLFFHEIFRCCFPSSLLYLPEDLGRIRGHLIGIMARTERRVLITHVRESGHDR